MPKFPPGKKTDSEKNPFQILIKIRKELHPHIGQIAINKEMTLTTPTAAPVEINFGLYYSTDVTPIKLGRIKVV